MQKTPRNIWYHSKFYGVNSYFNGEDGTIITKTSFGDFCLNALFSFDELLFILFDLTLFPKEGFEVKLINREITDKDWENIQLALEGLIDLS